MNLIKELMMLREEDESLADKLQDHLETHFTSYDTSHDLGNVLGLDEYGLVSGAACDFSFEVEEGGFISDLHDDPAVQAALKDKETQKLKITVRVDGTDLSSVEPHGSSMLPQIDGDSPTGMDFIFYVTAKQAEEFIANENPTVDDFSDFLGDDAASTNVTSKLRDYKYWDEMKSKFEDEDGESCPECGAGPDDYDEDEGCANCGHGQEDQDD